MTSDIASAVMLLLVTGFLSEGLPAEAQGLPNYKPALRQLVVFDEERSANYSGPLRAFSDIRALVNGKTLYLERPIVAGQRLVTMKTEEVYFAVGGRAQGETFSGATWTIVNGMICLIGDAQRNCLRVLQDATDAIFLQAENGMLSHVTRVGNGDSANLAERYERYVEQINRTRNINNGILERMNQSRQWSLDHCYDMWGKYVSRPGCNSP